VAPEPDVLDRLLEALDGLARVLETGSPEAVLAAEVPVAAATGALRAAGLARIAGRPDARAAIMNVRLAIARCEALGASAGAIAAVLAPSGYGPAGAHLPPAAMAPTVTTRT
jgi:hypothetical protein